MSKRRNYKTPDFLDGIAKTKWKSRIKQLSERGDIKAEDFELLDYDPVKPQLKFDLAI